MNGLDGLRGEKRVHATPEEAAGALAEVFAEHVRARLAAVEVVHVALSGGSSSKLLGPALQARRALATGEWSRVHIWMVDERCVSDDDPNLNFSLIRRDLAAPLAIPASNLHPMPVLRAHGDEEYAQALAEAFAPRAPDDRRFDLVVLGMGPDGHTASLFPQSPALDERRRWVAFNDGDRVLPPRPRMTLTYPALTSAHLIALLVTGDGKHPALTRASAGQEDFHELPVVGVSPGGDGRLVWFLDQAALPAP